MKKLIIVLLIVFLCPACFPDTLTVEYLKHIQTGIENAKKNQARSNELILNSYKKSITQLDSAFDADIELYFSKKNIPSNKETVNWIISSRKGYSIARNLIHKNIINQIAFNTNSLNNLTSISKLSLEVKKKLESKNNVSKKFYEFINSIIPGSKNEIFNKKYDSKSN